MKLRKTDICNMACRPGGYSITETLLCQMYLELFNDNFGDFEYNYDFYNLEGWDLSLFA